MKSERDRAIPCNVDGAVISDGEIGEEVVFSIRNGRVEHLARTFDDVHAYHRNSCFGKVL